MKFIGYLLLLVIALLALIFACLNAEPVTINYYVRTASLPLSLILTMAFVSGAIFGLLACTVWVFSVKKEMRHLRQRYKLTERELANLRTMPLQDPR